MTADDDMEGRSLNDADGGEDDELETDESDLTADDDDNNSVASSEGSKKKKKKKKKKKGKGDNAAAIVTATSADAAGGKLDKVECEKRFNTAMECVRSSEDMWIKLSNCNIFDAKTKKLMEALKGNCSITSLDLSQNNISDEGAQVIASILSTHGAPELIELDLRDNPFTEQGLSSLEGLKKSRKQLAMKLGTTASEPDALSPTGSAAASTSGTAKDLTKGPMFRRYFQTGDDDDEGPSSSHNDAQLLQASIPPDELWRKVEEAVKDGAANIPEISSVLLELINFLSHELGTLQLPQNDTAVDGSRPHIKGCILHLEVLTKILDIVPRRVITQFSSEPLPAVGSHRVWVSEVVAMLLAPNNSAIDRLIANSKLVSRVLQLSLQQPHCSALHTRALRILRSCCISKVPALYGPVFTSGLGAALTPQDSKELCGSLQQQLADIALPALGIPSGKRSAVMGFVVEACKVLLACCDEANRDSIFNMNVRRLLQMDDKWAEFIREGGPLAELCKEQEGDLCGPRAARMPMDDNQDLAEMAGGGLISGHEILALLQGMGAMNVMG